MIRTGGILLVGHVAGPLHLHYLNAKEEMTCLFLRFLGFLVTVRRHCTF